MPSLPRTDPEAPSPHDPDLVARQLKAVDEMMSRIVTLKSNPHYRVADVVYMRGFRFADSARNIMESPAFDGTILKDYLLQNGGCAKRNIPLLADLLETRIRKEGWPSPDDDELVLHVRAGDVVVLDWFLKKDYIKLIREHIQRHPDTRKISIVTCFAYQEYHEKGWWLYTEEKQAKNTRLVRRLFHTLVTTFEDREFDVVSHRDPDHDMAYVVQAKHFIPDRGGFSELMEAIRAKRMSRGRDRCAG